MKLTVTRENLLKLCAKVVPIVKGRTTMPVLQCVLIEAMLGKLRAYATDLEQEIETMTPASVSDPGICAVNGQDLAARAKTLPEGEITIVVAKDKLTMMSGKRKHVLPTLPADEFPPVTRPEGEQIAIPAPALRALFGKIRHAMSDDATRPSFYGALLEFEIGKLRSMATDGKRISVATVDCADMKPRPKALIPSPAVVDLIDLIGGDGVVTVHLSTARAWFSIEGPNQMTFCTKMPEPNFPPVKDLLSAPPKGEMTVQTAAILSALHSVEMASGKTEKDVRNFVEMQFLKGNIHIKANGRGEAEDDVDVAYDGTEERIGMCSTYLCQAIEACCTESVRIRISAGCELDPVWVQPATGDDVCIVMPARL